MPRLAAPCLAAGLLAWLISHSPAAAQSPQPPLSPDRQAPGSSTSPAPPASRLDCPPGVDPNRAPTIGRDGAGAAGGTTGSATGQSLSEQLAHSGGVVCPPAGTDPGLVEPPPQGGALQVIPPPGTPGGEPAPRPK